MICIHVFANQYRATVPSVPRGGMVPLTGLMYPDATTNVLHAYAELDKHTDEEIEHIHEVKATATKKHHPHWADEDYEDEDLFFHALIHNNDNKFEIHLKPKKSGRFDNDLFEKLNDKIFHHHEAVDDEHKTTEKKTVSLHLHDVLDDDEFFALE